MASNYKVEIMAHDGSHWLDVLDFTESEQPVPYLRIEKDCLVYNNFSNGDTPVFAYGDYEYTPMYGAYNYPIPYSKDDVVILGFSTVDTLLDDEPEFKIGDTIPLYDYPDGTTLRLYIKLGMPLRGVYKFAHDPIDPSVYDLGFPDDLWGDTETSRFHALNFESNGESFKGIRISHGTEKGTGSYVYQIAYALTDDGTTTTPIVGKIYRKTLEEGGTHVISFDDPRYQYIIMYGEAQIVPFDLWEWFVNDLYDASQWQPHNVYAARRQGDRYVSGTVYSIFYNPYNSDTGTPSHYLSVVENGLRDDMTGKMVYINSGDDTFLGMSRDSNTLNPEYIVGSSFNIAYWDNAYVICKDAVSVCGKEYTVVLGWSWYEFKNRYAYDGFIVGGVDDFATQGIRVVFDDGTSEPLLNSNGISFDGASGVDVRDEHREYHVASGRLIGSTTSKDHYIISAETLKAIADAIRAKTGKTAPIAVENFAAEIASIQKSIKNVSGTITLLASEWTDGQQVKSFEHAVADTSAIMFTPKTREDKVTAEESDLFATTGDGTVTFTVETTPTDDITLIYYVINDDPECSCDCCD